MQCALVEPPRKSQRGGGGEGKLQQRLRPRVRTQQLVTEPGTLVWQVSGPRPPLDAPAGAEDSPSRERSGGRACRRTRIGAVGGRGEGGAGAAYFRCEGDSADPDPSAAPSAEPDERRRCTVAAVPAKLGDASSSSAGWPRPVEAESAATDADATASVSGSAPLGEVTTRSAGSSPPAASAVPTLGSALWESAAAAAAASGLSAASGDEMDGLRALSSSGSASSLE